jgi:uncharacterized delta-60 repeat protein
MAQLTWYAKTPGDWDAADAWNDQADGAGTDRTNPQNGGDTYICDLNAKEMNLNVAVSVDQIRTGATNAGGTIHVPDSTEATITVAVTNGLYSNYAGSMLTWGSGTCSLTINGDTQYASTSTSGMFPVAANQTLTGNGQSSGTSSGYTIVESGGSVVLSNLGDTVVSQTANGRGLYSSGGVITVTGDTLVNGTGNTHGIRYDSSQTSSTIAGNFTVIQSDSGTVIGLYVTAGKVTWTPDAAGTSIAMSGSGTTGAFGIYVYAGTVVCDGDASTSNTKYGTFAPIRVQGVFQYTGSHNLAASAELEIHSVGGTVKFSTTVADDHLVLENNGTFVLVIVGGTFTHTDATGGTASIVNQTATSYAAILGATDEQKAIITGPVLPTAAQTVRTGSGTPYGYAGDPYDGTYYPPNNGESPYTSDTDLVLVGAYFGIDNAEEGTGEGGGGYTYGDEDADKVPTNCTGAGTYVLVAADDAAHKGSGYFGAGGASDGNLYGDLSQAKVLTTAAWPGTVDMDDYTLTAGIVWPAEANVSDVETAWGPTGAEYAGALDVDALEAAAYADGEAAQLATDQAAVGAVAAYITTDVQDLLGTVDGTLNMALYTLISGVASQYNVRSGIACYTSGPTGLIVVPSAADVRKGVLVNVEAAEGTLVGIVGPDGTLHSSGVYHATVYYATGYYNGTDAPTAYTLYALKTDYTDPGKANVVVGNDYTYAGASQVAEYPTTATSKAQQLADDIAEVETHLDNIDGEVVVLTGAAGGTGVNATTIRTALGMAEADLDDKFAAIPTAADNADAVLDAEARARVIADLFPGSVSSVECQVIQDDDKIVVGGGLYIDGVKTAYVLRLTANGLRDATFGTDGLYVYSGGTVVNSLALQADGKIVFGFNDDASPPRDYLGRLTTTGLLDDTFGTEGIVSGLGGSLGEYGVRTLLIQSDGKIVAGGALTGWGAWIERRDSDGSLDDTFGTGGLLTFEPAVSHGFFGAVQQSDGKLVFVGYNRIPDPTVHHAMVLRLTTAGALDDTFGAGGMVIDDGDESRFEDVLLDSDDKILCCGFQTVDEVAYTLVRRFTTAGAIDATFDHVLGELEAMTLGPNGTLLAAGGSWESDDDESCVVARFLLSDGTLDATFGSEGQVLTTWMDLARPAYWNAIGQQSSGQIVVSGLVNDAEWDDLSGAAARLLANGAVEPTFGTQFAEYTAARAAAIDHLDADVSSRLAPTTAGRTLDVDADGAVALPEAPEGYGASMSEEQIEALAAAITADKSGYKLAADGLDSITATEVSEKPTNFRQWLRWLCQRFSTTSKTPTQLSVKTEAGATVTTQALASDGQGTESVGPPS